MEGISRTIKVRQLLFAFFAVVLVLLLLGINNAFATITKDAVSSSAPTGKVGSITWSHTVNNGDSRILIVGVSLRKNDQSVSSVTYGGSALTKIGTQIGPGADHRVELWYRLAPTVGTANIVVTLAGGTVEATAGAISFFGVDQTTPLGSFVGAQNTNTSPTVTVTSASGEIVVDTLTASGDSGTVTAGSGQTIQWSGSSGTGDGNDFGAGSTEAGASSVTMSWTLTNSNKWAIAAVPLKPAPAPSPTDLIGLRTNLPAKFYFSGEAYPNAIVYLDLLDERHNLLRNITSQTTDYAGKFFIYIDEPMFGPHFYGFTLRDRAGNILGVKFYNYDVEANLVIRQTVIFPPTMTLNKTLISEDESLIISGHGSPGNNVQVVEGNEIRASGEINNSAEYRLTVPLNPGQHWLGVRQINEVGVMSDISDLRSVTVGDFKYTSIDLNADGQINIADWSIFLFNWSSPNEAARSQNDLNGDGSVNVSDFSIFLTSFTEAQ